MRFTPFYFVFTLFIFFQSCGNKQVEKNKVQREQIIAVHDEVMPKMGQLKSMEKAALQKVEELQSSDVPNLEKIESLKNLASQLNLAYEGMFVWMRQYNTEDGEQTPEEVKAYLEEQLLLVSKVNEDIKVALDQAEQLLKD
jgi:transposase-like protein